MLSMWTGASGHATVFGGLSTVSLWGGGYVRRLYGGCCGIELVGACGMRDMSFREVSSWRDRSLIHVGEEGSVYAVVGYALAG